MKKSKATKKAAPVAETNSVKPEANALAQTHALPKVERVIDLVRKLHEAKQAVEDAENELKGELGYVIPLTFRVSWVTP